MKIKNYFLLCLVAMMAVTACKKSGTPPPPIKIDTDVYVMGQIKVGTNDVVAYWKNGVLTKLSDTTKNCEPIGKIFVNGSDVYAAGFYDSTRRVPLYWKNGKETRLSVPDSVTRVYLFSYTVNNNSVYAVGEIDGPNGHSEVYWQDSGMPIPLSDVKFVPHAIAVDGTGVDFAGYTYSAAIPGNASAYLKGNTVQLSTDNLRGNVYAMVLNGADIFTSGYTYDASTHLYKATYWKNGNPTYLTNGSSSETAVAIIVNNNGDVCTAGYTEAANHNNIATYWRNGTVGAILGDNGVTDSEASGIAVAGDVVYASGYSGTVTGYWRNGEMKPLPGATYVTGIAAVTHPHK